MLGNFRKSWSSYFVRPEGLATVSIAMQRGEKPDEACASPWAEPCVSPREEAEMVVTKCPRSLPILAVLAGCSLSTVLAAPAKTLAPVSRDYAVLAELPLVQRRAVYGTLDAETQSALWREQIALYLESHANLPAREWLLLTEIGEALTPDLLADLRQPRNPGFAAARKAVGVLEARAREELSPANQDVLLERLGPAGASDERPPGPACFLWLPNCEPGRAAGS
jgi:hypothetical protein